MQWWQRGGGEGDGVAARRALSLSPKLRSLPAETPSRSFFSLPQLSRSAYSPGPHSSPRSGRSLSRPRAYFSSLSPSSLPDPPPRCAPTRGTQLSSRHTARPVAARGSGACALRRRRPPPPLPAAELCQVCEEPARASAGHGEPPPSPPPPRAQIFPELGSVLFPQQGRAWLLRRRGWRTL